MNPKDYVLWKDEKGENLFIQALRVRDEVRMLKYIKENPKCIEVPNVKDQNCLVLMASECYYEGVSKIAKACVDVKPGLIFSGKVKKSALDVAIEYNRPELKKIFSEKAEFLRNFGTGREKQR